MHEQLPLEATLKSYSSEDMKQKHTSRSCWSTCISNAASKSDNGSNNGTVNALNESVTGIGCPLPSRPEDVCSSINGNRGDNGNGDRHKGSASASGNGHSCG